MPTLAPNGGASGGTSGGRTGTGGAGSVPIGVLNGEVYIDAIICPMPGAAYGDSWGAPRSGGRRHEGVDMLAPTGTPIYAVVSGSVSFKQNRLGGNAVSLAGDNGNRYYYAHLSRYEGVSRRVNQGDVIGYNGDTGNATGIPHLHFEVHPGGGLADRIRPHRFASPVADGSPRCGRDPADLRISERWRVRLWGLSCRRCCRNSSTAPRSTGCIGSPVGHRVRPGDSRPMVGR